MANKSVSNEIKKLTDLDFGIKNEEPVKTILEQVFKLKLNHSKYKYSLFDYFDAKKKYIFEIKNYRYPYIKYKYEIIGIIKGISDNCIFVFQHEETDIYFIQFNKDLFKTFTQRNIYYRGVNSLCYDIPKQHLTQININSNYELKYTIEDIKIIKQIINKDTINYNNSLKIKV